MQSGGRPDVDLVFTKASQVVFGKESPVRNTLFSAALAMALVIGSIGAAPLIDRIGLAAALWAGLVGIVAAGFIAAADGGLRGHPRRAASPAM
jgi:predicted MFS family arabinose efflux permease